MAQSCPVRTKLTKKLARVSRLSDVKDCVRKIKMGRQPRSGDIPWLSAHSILNWIGGDISMLFLFTAKSRGFCRILRAILVLCILWQNKDLSVDVGSPGASIRKSPSLLVGDVKPIFVR